MKKKTRIFLFKNRKKIRTIKALVMVLSFSALKYGFNIDVDAIFIALAFWWVMEIRQP